MIGFDFDGVISDTYSIFRGHFYDVYGVDMGNEFDHHSYEFIVEGVSPEDYWKEVPVAIAMYQHICPAVKGSIEGMTRYYDTEINERKPLQIITAREPSQPVMQATYKWLNKHLPVPYEVTFLRSSTEKKFTIMDKGINYFIDDKRSTCIELSEIIPLSFMLKQPWNDAQYRHDKLPDNVIPVFSINEMLDRLLTMIHL